MIINIDQDDYVRGVGDTAGIRAVIHSQERMPFPEDEGVTISPGHSTAISIRQVPYQLNWCTLTLIFLELGDLSNISKYH